MLGADWMRNQRSDGWEIFRVDGGWFVAPRAHNVGTAIGNGPEAWVKLIM